MGRTWTVLYDFEAEEEGELSVSAGELVEVVGPSCGPQRGRPASQRENPHRRGYKGWMDACGDDGRPASYWIRARRCVQRRPARAARPAATGTASCPVCGGAATLHRLRDPSAPRPVSSTASTHCPLPPPPLRSLPCPTAEYLGDEDEDMPQYGFGDAEGAEGAVDGNGAGGEDGAWVEPTGLPDGASPPTRATQPGAGSPGAQDSARRPAAGAESAQREAPARAKGSSPPGAFTAAAPRTPASTSSIASSGVHGALSAASAARSSPRSASSVAGALVQARNGSAAGGDPVHQGASMRQRGALTALPPRPHPPSHSHSHAHPRPSFASAEQAAHQQGQREGGAETGLAAAGSHQVRGAACMPPLPPLHHSPPLPISPLVAPHQRGVR